MTIRRVDGIGKRGGVGEDLAVIKCHGLAFSVKVLLLAYRRACDTVEVGETVGTTMWQSTAGLVRQSAILLGLAFGPANLVLDSQAPRTYTQAGTSAGCRFHTQHRRL